MPRKVFDDNNISRGKNFEKVCKMLFPGASRESIGAKLGGVPGNTIKNWEKGRSIANKVLAELERRGVSLTWLLRSEGEIFSKDMTDQYGVGEPGGVAARDRGILLPEPNAVRRPGDSDADYNVLHYPVAGLAAADESRGARAGVFNEDVSTPFDDIALPETTHFVKILGDSMSPMLMDGQYAIVGTEYVLPYSQPRSREIVIAEVIVKDKEQAGTDLRFEGVYCKRVVDIETAWLFESINYTGAPFSIAKSNCRLWPVIGVYFAGKGKPPEED